MRVRIWLGLTAVAAIAGLLFASVSTYDFVAHLDRQVHGLHCSFLPGMSSNDPAAAAGCQATMMSPYSSVFRDDVWGGIPISLPAMGVFAFLLFFSLWIAIRGRGADPRATGFLFLATLVPVIASIVMAYVAFTKLDAVCKLCIGIYASSALAFVGALGAFLSARPDEGPVEELAPPEPISWGFLAGAFALGVFFVAAPTMAYAANAPDFERYVGACGTLASAEDPNGVMVPLGSQAPGVPVIEVLDPLCPSCRAFERRFAALEPGKPTRRAAVLFPLDDECNWMVDHAIHPGACAISEAILCAEDNPEAVLEWAFEQQEAIVEASKADPAAAARMAKARFPALAECIGSPRTRARLNLGLRWAVENQIPVLTPQVYVGDTRVCDEDTDLGVDFVLARLIERVPASARPPVTERALELVELRGTTPPGGAAAPAGEAVLTQAATAAGAAETGAEATTGAAPEAAPEQPAMAAEPSAAPAAAAPTAPAAPAAPAAAAAAPAPPSAQGAEPTPEPPPSAAPAAPATTDEQGATP